MAPSTGSVTQLLIEWGDGDKAALDRLIPLVYRELRQRAHRYMNGERSGHLLQTTALINEAYLKLISHKEMKLQNRHHFYAVAAIAMRRILVDYARHRDSIRGGGRVVIIPIDLEIDVGRQRDAALVALDDALTEFEALDPLKSRIVELKYFGGLTIVEIADLLKVSEVTVTRSWSTAKGWLLRAMSPPSHRPSEKEKAPSRDVSPKKIKRSKPGDAI